MRIARSLLFACALALPTVAFAENASAPAPLAAPLFAIPGIDSSTLAVAVARYDALRAEGRAKKPRLVFIDYSKPSTERRLWVIDMEKHEVLFHELVAHGRGSGDLLAAKFGNDAESHLTSLGTFLTAE